MESMGQTRPRPRRSFTAEFEAEMVEAAAARGSVDQAGRPDFDATETAVRQWVKQAERGTTTAASETSAQPFLQPMRCVAAAMSRLLPCSDT